MKYSHTYVNQHRYEHYLYHLNILQYLVEDLQIHEETTRYESVKNSLQDKEPCNRGDSFHSRLVFLAELNKDDEANNEVYCVQNNVG